MLVLALVAGALPVTDTLAKWSRRPSAGRHGKRYRKHSRAWWRRHRALQRARRERAEQRRRQRLAHSPRPARKSAPKSSAPSATSAEQTPARNSSVNTSLLSFDGANAPTASRASGLPFEFNVPHTWTPVRRAGAGGAVFSVKTPDGRQAGTAVVSPVTLQAAAVAGAASTAKTKTVGGFPVTALRRTVIDRMVDEGGWVTNDFVQEMHGRRVFVVLAQTGTPGTPAQTWAFYFTEIDGRVYSLATTTPVEFAEPVAAGSAQFIASLRTAASSNAASRK
jgi:hypothetical protein